jgi:hypothetical protein
VDPIRLPGAVTSITVTVVGTAAVESRGTDKDSACSGGAGFAEDEEYVPFRIVVGPGSSRFTFQRRELSTFDLDGTDGHLALR